MAALLIVLPLIGVALSGIGVLHFWLVPPPHEFDVTEGEPFEVTAAEGQKVRWMLLGHAIGGEWASSTGITIQFNDTVLDVAGPRAANWGDEIAFTAGHAHQFRIKANFVVPDFDEQTPSTVHGELVGTIKRPIASGGYFEEDTLVLDVPIIIHLISEEQAGEITQESMANSLKWLFITGTIALAGATITGVVALVQRSRT